jgi:hypothetical protein
MLFGRNRVAVGQTAQRHPQMRSREQNDRDERCLVSKLALAIPEVVRHAGQEPLAAWSASLKGIRVAQFGRCKQRLSDPE